MTITPVLRDAFDVALTISPDHGSPARRTSSRKADSSDSDAKAGVMAMNGTELERWSTQIDSA